MEKIYYPKYPKKFRRSFESWLRLNWGKEIGKRWYTEEEKKKNVLGYHILDGAVAYSHKADDDKGKVRIWGQTSEKIEAAKSKLEQMTRVKLMEKE